MQKTTRRDFLRHTAVAGAAAMLPGQSLAKSMLMQQAATPKKLLILGGTSFLGPAVVRAALARGHTLTLFNRGKTRPGLFPDIEQLHGDRDGDLKSLEGRKWDCVLDTSGYVPRIVKLSAELLKDAVKHYIFISTISVYADTSKPIDESSPLAKMEDESSESVKEYYGALKALCEQAAEKIMPGRVTNIRPGLIVGPEDPSDRFTYWPVRIDRGGDVLAPGSADDQVQVIDVRDLGEWIVKVMEDGTTGLFNTTGPDKPLSMGRMLEACQHATKSESKLIWADADFLEANKVQGWSDMPVWLPPRGETACFAKVDCRKAIAKGLKFRPIDEIAKDTLAWFKTLPEERRAKLRAGIKPEREVEVLAELKKRGGKSG
ncbi:MAG: NAD-dependent epimerase/dehydratase family protein [Phycisphaerae bacterium]